MNSKPTRVFSTSGTLVGVAVPLDLQELAGEGFSSTYAEVHNLDLLNDYTVTIQGFPFILPALRALRLPSFINVFSINGTGDYIVLAGDNPAVETSQTALPSLTSPAQPVSVVTAVTPDNVTLENVGPVTQVKDLGISTAKLAALAVTGAKLAASAVDTSKLADLAATFNKVGSGVNQNPGRGAAVIFDSTGVIVGDRLTLTFAGAPVIYEFTNGGAPAPGTIGVDIPTIVAALPAAVLANQPLVSCSGTAGVFWMGISVLSLVQAATTLTAVSTGLTVVENIAPVGEARVGLEFHQWSITALNAAAGYPIYHSGTIAAKWFMETTVGGTQLSTVGIGFTPLATGDGITVSGSGTVGNIMHVLLAITY